MSTKPPTSFEKELTEILQGFYHKANTDGMNDLYDDSAVPSQAITDLVDKLAISQDRFSDTGDLPMMEAIDCENNENAQNRLRAEQRRVINR